MPISKRTKLQVWHGVKYEKSQQKVTELTEQAKIYLIFQESYIREVTRWRSLMVCHNKSMKFIVSYDLNIFHFISHEKGLGRAQMLCYNPLLTIVTHVFINNVHWSNNTFTQHIHTNVASLITHIQNCKIAIHSLSLIAIIKPICK